MKPYELFNEIKLGIIYELWKAKQEGLPILQESELARRINVHPTTVSQNTKDLIKLKMIKIKRIGSGKGKPKYYSLNEENAKYKAIINMLSKFQSAKLSDR